MKFFLYKPVQVFLFLFFFRLWILPISFAWWYKKSLDNVCFTYSEWTIPHTCLDEDADWNPKSIHKRVLRDLFFNVPFPFASNMLNEMYRVACLFTHKTTYRRDLDIQIQLSWSGERHNTRYDDFSSMRVFGHLDRLRWIYDNLPTKDPLYRWAMADFVKERFEFLYPESWKVSWVRFVLISYPVVSWNPREFPPTWRRKPHLDTLPDKYQKIDFTKQF